MNEELQILLGMMNGDDSMFGQPAAGSGEGRNPNMNTLGQNAQEVEITPEMKSQHPVVNKARGRNNMTGASEFLANPEVQNALITFGQAFSNAGNFSGQPNPIDVIGNAGREAISGRADQAALEAFERGDPIAESTNRFANPELVASLQQRRQQMEPFDQEIGLRERGLDLDERSIENDAVYRQAKMSLDTDLAEARIGNLESQQAIDKQMADAQQAWWEAQAEALGSGTGFTESLALRTNEFIEVLSERENLVDQEIGQIRDALEDLDIQLTDAEINGLVSGDRTVEDLDLSDADASNWPGFAGTGPEQAKALATQLGTAASRRGAIQGQLETLQNIQTSRLTGQTQSDRDRQQQEEGGGGPTPRGTPQEPVTVSTMAELTSLPPGSIGRLAGGDPVEIGPAGELLELTEEEEDNE